MTAKYTLIMLSITSLTRRTTLLTSKAVHQPSHHHTYSQRHTLRRSVIRTRSTFPRHKPG
ncbi:hypothetical protein OBBRIDRAFT_28137 [Obba rivulosa]|uniref:Uncharacterized protein n=1 Tax=Obba rivulosa TaxID=1052685 RepID=A0A8E2AS33_9APHY|nr:hypothetical protein OBBRIDRAFT_28137 [Obba rivulosa]